MTAREWRTDVGRDFVNRRLEVCLLAALLIGNELPQLRQQKNSGACAKATQNGDFRSRE